METRRLSAGAKRLRPAWLAIWLGALLSLMQPALLALADPWYRPQPVIGVVDASAAPERARQAGVTWDRVLFLWQEIQPWSERDWYLDAYLQRTGLKQRLESGLPLVAVIQGTPQWAAVDPKYGAGAVPRGLGRPHDDPENTFGKFLTRLANETSGRFQAWIIWNEPDFDPGGPGSWWTWSGGPEEFGQLMRTAFGAIRAKAPGTQVVFPATSYFADVMYGRTPYLERVLRSLARDPEAARHGFYFDAVAVNLYCSLDAVQRVRGEFAEILARYKLVKPIWLTELNCQVYGDAAAPVEPKHHISTSEQAAFLVQSIALARAAGYQRIGWYSMRDHDPASGILDRWGLLRADGSARPAFSALRTATRYLGDPEQSARFAPLGKRDERGNWPLWRVVLSDFSKRERVQVLWRSPQGPRVARLQAHGEQAYTVDALGRTRTVRKVNGAWEVELPPARVPQPFDPLGYLAVGDPLLLVESGVGPGDLRLTPALTSEPPIEVPPVDAPPVAEAVRGGAVYGSAAPAHLRPVQGIALLCDWDGNGTRTLGMVAGGTWHIRNAAGSGRAEYSFRYGSGDEIPICGDWDGNGTETPGVFRDGVWHLRNSATDGVADISFRFGAPGHVPVVGDWDGDGTDTPGVFADGTWHLRNSSTDGMGEVSFVLGRAGDAPAAHPWRGTGPDRPGVLRDGRWHVRHSLTSGEPEATFRVSWPADAPNVWP